MSKWKCGICGNEFDNYHAQGFDDIIYCPLCYFKEEYKRTNKMLKVYKKQLQQKENIIKEIKEYIKNIPEDEFVESEHFTELLYILDKVEENNEQ